MVFKMAFNQILENVQINNMVLAAAGEGVLSGLDVSERGAGVNMSVDVATGAAHINGTTHTESSIVNLAISAADATHARKDLVVYDVATTNPLVITGTPATPPVPPDITAGDVLLAIVDVAANETEITNSEITDCIVEIQRLDELAAPTDVTTLNSTTSTHGLMKKLCGNSFQFLNGVGAWATPAGSGDMMRSTYDPDTDGVIAMAQLDVGIASRLWVDQHNWAATDITSGTLPVARGGTGVTGDTYDADKVDGCDAGTFPGQVHKLGTQTYWGGIYAVSAANVVYWSPGTDGYQFTTHGNDASPSWSAKSDLIFSDTHCPKCGQEFQDGDDLILHVIGHNEVGDILTLPMHQSCANQPKKTVTLQRIIMEDRHVLDEETGELKVQRVRRTQEKTVTRHKLKEGCAISSETGKAYRVPGKGKKRKAIKLTEAVEAAEETIEEVVYEDVEYEL